jgi:hypothetical protein
VAEGSVPDVYIRVGCWSHVLFGPQAIARHYVGDRLRLHVSDDVLLLVVLSKPARIECGSRS